jgi:hypothetical protein
MEESRAEVAALAATVTEMRDTIKCTSEPGRIIEIPEDEAEDLDFDIWALGENTRAAITPPH